MFAHTLPRPATKADWEPLEKHLEEVANLAGDFAAAFGAKEWGELAGAWHDLGKFSQEFQDYISRANDADAGEESKVRSIDHATFGARYACRKIPGPLGRIIAYCIAGHHAGLPNYHPSDSSAQRSSLQFRLEKKEIPAVDESLIPATHLPVLGNKLKSDSCPGFTVAFFTRMLFSALIDADRLATEAFCNPDSAQLRKTHPPSLADLESQLLSFLGKLNAGARPSEVNRCRQTVLNDSLTAATLPAGFFSLNVPTGGGKTLASLAFALRHALQSEHRRIIVVAPFTSIIEQTADVYRNALGALAEHSLIEHHTNVEPSRATRANQAAAENWDAPLIVTTNVQLFESLFAAKTTPCRKLHRLARSVIVLDEAQTIPIDFLQPTLAALRELVGNYQCSVVLCTATQPALEKSVEFPIGIQNVRPIVHDTATLFNALKRVEVIRLGKLDDPELSARLATASQVLCVVNTRKHASTLYHQLGQLVPLDECFHLSTLMCAAHRREVLSTIRDRLAASLPCRVISTQLIEAGVDIDFPIVFRAPAGFDSIAQSAGRCNREGKADLGFVYLFETEKKPPHGYLRNAADTASGLANLHPDPLTIQATQAYFRELYWKNANRWDYKSVMACFNVQRDLSFDFQTAAERYQLIESSFSILVPYGQGAELHSKLLKGIPADRHILRSAQPYFVSVRPEERNQLVSQGAVIEDPNGSGLSFLLNSNFYSQNTGLLINYNTVNNSGTLIV